MSWLLSFLMLGLLSCASPEGGAEKPGADATDMDESAAVRAVAERWDPAVNAEDIDAIMALQADDVVRLPTGGPALAGAEAVRKDFASAFERKHSEESNPVSEVQVAGDWAFAHGTYEDTSGGATERGKWVSIFKKTPDGWKYAVDIWNRDAPVESAFASGGESPSPPEPSVPEELKTLFEAWDAALVAGDADAIMRHFMADSLHMPADAPLAVGLAAIRANFEKELAAPPDSSKGITNGYGVAENWAYAWGTWTETRGSEEERGKWLNVLKRTPEGWKIYIDIWNPGA